MSEGTMASTNSENNSSEPTENSRKRAAESGGEATCRDFLRNACTRGKSCKYLHPDEAAPENKSMEFCHDYQNRGKCRRPQCKYVHCTEEEEKIYHQSGALPFNIDAGPGGPNNTSPVCKDFLNGVCTRALCKFRHIYEGRDFGEMNFDKRRRIDYDSARMEYADRMRMIDDENIYLRRRLADREDEIVSLRRRLLSLEGDIESLQRKLVADPQSLQLKKQVADLASMNEILLEQNARLKLNSGSDGSAAAYSHKSSLPGMPPSSMAGGANQGQNYMDQKYTFGQGGGAGGSAGMRYM